MYSNILNLAKNLKQCQTQSANEKKDITKIITP